MWRKFRESRGSALMLAIFTTSLVIFLTGQIAEQTIMEYLTSATEVRRVQARYTAEACLRLNLLRIKAYQQVTRTMGQSVPDMGMLDMIWNFPLNWPPAMPTEGSSADKSTMKRQVSGSLLKGEFVSSIIPEGGKIDINDLGSPSQGLQQRTRMQLLQRFRNRVLNERDAFAERYANFNFELLLNHIADWVDADTQSRNGGDEASYYPEFQNAFIPPNRPFKTMQELHMVKEMTDEIYEFLRPMITLYGVKGINVNHADRDVLLTLFSDYPPQVGAMVVPEILRRRNDPNLGGPFRDENDFMGFLSAFMDTSMLQNPQTQVPLFFGQELNFRINCTGVAGKMTTDIQAVVYDAEAVMGRLQQTLAQEQMLMDNPNCEGRQGEELFQCLCQGRGGQQEQQQCIEQKKGGGAGPGGAGGQMAAPLPPGPPRILFQRME